LSDEFQKVDILVNNAGNAHGLDFIEEGDYRDWDLMIDSNVKGLLYVSEVVIPKMIEAGGGHIINLSSVAGKEVYPKGNVYCASKFAVEAISQGMRIDLNKHGIKVTNIAPGAVNTEFSLVRFKEDKERADNVYKGFDPLTATDIAETITFIVTRPAHVTIADLTILPLAQASATVFNKKL
jgi:NADP-dependent 3-hydroxy acid dehydrogenase YdfG